jgi:hypothetical protein
MKRTPKRVVLPLAAVKAGLVLAIALAAVWLTGLAGTAGRPTRVWQGFYTLLIRADSPRADELGPAAQALGPGVVAETTATVSFWSFTGVQKVTVDEIGARIDRSDPRRDRVMDALAGYFQARRASGGSGWRILYIPARRAASAEYLRIAALLGLPWRGGWRLEEFNPVEFLLSAAALLAMAAILASPLRKGRRERLVLAVTGALLWIPFLLPGGVARLALSLLILATWHSGLESLFQLHGWDEKLVRESRGPIMRLLTASAAGLILLVPGSGFSAAAALSYAGAIAASGLIVVSLALLWGRARRPRARRKAFEPVPILKSSKPSPAPSGPGTAVFFLPFAAVAIVAAMGFFRSIPLPSPLPVPGARDFSWESLQRLSRNARAQRLPDLSDLVTHEAFQETLALGRPWGLPRADEMVYLREFSPNARAGTIVAVMRRVKVFDATWLAASLGHPPEGSIEGLLVSQRRPVAVAVRGQARGLLREIPVAVLALFLVSAWFARDLRTAPLMRSVLLRFNDAARRNQAP